MEFHGYFQSYKDYFWCWEEQAEVLAIPKGSTIAYRAFLLQVLEHLADQGFPPFGALLLAIIATNHTMGDDIKQVEENLKEIILKQAPEDIAFGPLQEAIVFMEVLSQLPRQYTQGNKRLLLFQALFENCHNMVSSVKARKALENIKYNLTHHYDELLHILERPEPFNPDVYQKDFRCIGLLIKKFPDVEAIISRMAALELVPELEIEQPEQVTSNNSSESFIEELISNNKTFQIGSLVKHIWSGLNIQLHNLLPSEQPLGGVSDLSNKGNFDKLLISEFANDDLVFLSRLANNEALYLHRETPPATDKLERVLLLDVSLRSWGTPKTLAYSVLVAIAKHPKTDIACTAFAVGDTYQPVRFNTVDEIIDSQNLLEGVLNPAMGLEQFFLEYNSGKKTEVLFISSPDTLKQPAVQKVISDFHASFKYWITTNQEGTLEFYKNQHSSKKLVQKIQLPLEELWKRPITTNHQPATHGSEVAEIPILYPYTANNKKFLRSDNDLFVVTPEKKLMRFYDASKLPAQKGLELWLDNLPSGVSSYEIGPDENGDYIFLCFKSNTRELTLYNITTKEKVTLHFQDWSRSYSPYFFFYQDTFYYLNIAHYWKVQQFPRWELEKHTVSGKELGQAYIARQEELQRAASAIHVGPASVIKNLSEVFINRNGNLVFNKHELLLNQYGVIQLKTSPESIRDASEIAHLTSTDNEFTFASGCSVTLNRSGMIILVSPASAEEDEQRYDVILQESGQHRLALTKVIQARTSLGLKQAKDVADNAPRVAASGIGKTEAEVLRMSLEEVGGTAQVVPVKQQNVVYIPSVLNAALGVATQRYFAGNAYYLPSKQSSLQVIDSKTFFGTHIKGFISKALGHGN
ncbi:MAG: ribosomal protein L7/L12 [Rufibacter sp.]